MVEMKVNRGREHKKYREWFLVWKRGLKPSEKFGEVQNPVNFGICLRRNDLKHRRGQRLSRIAFIL
jgi:hypothetical protein